LQGQARFAHRTCIPEQYIAEAIMRDAIEYLRGVIKTPGLRA